MKQCHDVVLMHNYLFQLMSVWVGSGSMLDQSLDVHLATCSAGTGSAVRQPDGRMLGGKGPAAALLHEITEENTARKFMLLPLCVHAVRE